MPSRRRSVATKAAALICCCAGAGLGPGELRASGEQTSCRDLGGVLVLVGGKRPRAVPVLSPYQERLVLAADFAGADYLVGGSEASAATSRPTSSLRHRPGRTWRASSCPGSGRASCRPWAQIGLRAFMDRGRDQLLQRLGDLVANLPSPTEEQAVGLLCQGVRDDPNSAPRGAPGRPLVKEVVERSSRDFHGRAPSQLKVRLVIGHVVGRVDHRPAHLSRVHSALLVLELRIAGASESSSTRGRPPPAHLPPGGVHSEARVLRAGKDRPDGAGSALLEGLQGALVESSVPTEHKKLSSSLAVDWSDLESFSRPRPKEAASVPIPRLPGAPSREEAGPRKTSSSSVTTSRSRRWSTTRTKMPSRARPGHGAQLMSSRPGGELRPGAGSAFVPPGCRSATCWRTRAMRTAEPSPLRCRCGRSGRTWS